jgi:hypothetical protein
MKTSGKRTVKQPAFVRSAERALARAARNVREENLRLGLPLLVWTGSKASNVTAN